MINLDDTEAVVKAQGGDSVVRSVDALGKQLEQAYHDLKKVQYPDEYRNVKNIVVCGMGGSRFPAHISRELYKESITIPYLVNDDYHLPGFVNEHTLVVLSSYSGTTEEVITCGEKAMKTGARVTAISGGGDLDRMMKVHNLPHYTFDPIHNPSQQPRIGFGYLVGGHLSLLEHLGFLTLGTNEFDHALTELAVLAKPLQLDTPQNENPAKQLAQKLIQRYPYYIVSEFLTGVGNALQNQTNETAKSISSFRIIPELNHHLMEGLKFPDDHRKIAIFILFFSSLYSAPIQKRFHITKDVIEQNSIETVWHELRGRTKLKQVFELMAFGAYLTMYLSVLYGQNPTAIPYVDYFKKKLKE